MIDINKEIKDKVAISTLEFIKGKVMGELEVWK